MENSFNHNERPSSVFARLRAFGSLSDRGQVTGLGRLPGFSSNLRPRLMIACPGAALMTLALLIVMTRLVSPGHDIRISTSTEALNGFPVRVVDREYRGGTPETGLPTGVARPIRPQRPPVQPRRSRAAASRATADPRTPPIQRGDTPPAALADEDTAAVDSEGGRVDWWGELDRQVRSERNDESWLIDRGLRRYRSVMQSGPSRRVEHGSSSSGETRPGEAWTSVYGDVEVAISENCRLVLPRTTSTLDFERHRPAVVNCRNRQEFQLDLQLGAPLRKED